MCHSDRLKQDYNKRKDGIYLQICNLGEHLIPAKQHSDFKYDSASLYSFNWTTSL